jgi:hypothetical protein
LIRTIDVRIRHRRTDTPPEIRATAKRLIADVATDAGLLSFA